MSTGLPFWRATPSRMSETIGCLGGNRLAGRLDGWSEDRLLLRCDEGVYEACGSEGEHDGGESVEEGRREPGHVAEDAEPVDGQEQAAKCLTGLHRGAQ